MFEISLTEIVEPGRKQRRRNANIEVGHCLIMTAILLLDIYIGLDSIGWSLFFAVVLVYLLYINPRFMNRKLMKCYWFSLDLLMGR